MPADEDWDDWIDTFVAKILKVLVSGHAKCQLERVTKASRKPENELIHAAVVTDLKRGSKIYMNAMRIPKKVLKPNSIGQIYDACCSNLMD